MSINYLATFSVVGQGNHALLVQVHPRKGDRNTDTGTVRRGCDRRLEIITARNMISRMRIRVSWSFYPVAGDRRSRVSCESSVIRRGTNDTMVITSVVNAVAYVVGRSGGHSDSAFWEDLEWLQRKNIVSCGRPRTSISVCLAVSDPSALSHVCTGDNSVPYIYFHDPNLHVQRRRAWLICYGSVPQSRAGSLASWRDRSIV